MTTAMTSKTITVKGREYLVQEWMGKFCVSQRRKTGWFRVTSPKTIECVLRECCATNT